MQELFSNSTVHEETSAVVGGILDIDRQDNCGEGGCEVGEDARQTHIHGFCGHVLEGEGLDDGVLRVLAPSLFYHAA